MPICHTVHSSAIALTSIKVHVQLRWHTAPHQITVGSGSGSSGALNLHLKHLKHPEPQLEHMLETCRPVNPGKSSRPRRYPRAGDVYRDVMYVWILRPVLTDSLPPDLLHAASLAHSSGPPASPVTHCKCILSALEWPASCERCVAQSWVVQRARPQPHPHPQVGDCAADVIIDCASEPSVLA